MYAATFNPPSSIPSSSPSFFPQIQIHSTLHDSDSPARLSTACFPPPPPPPHSPPRTMTEAKRLHAVSSARISKNSSAVFSRSKGFATRDQRLPASPPLLGPAAATARQGPGIIAAVRARYRDALDLLFGTPPRVLNASCAAGVVTIPSQQQQPRQRKEKKKNKQTHYPKRRRQSLALWNDKSDEEESDEKMGGTDQVVPGGLQSPALRERDTDDVDAACSESDGCRCAYELWTAGGVGPELMLRTAEELSERILMLYGKAVDPETSDVDYSSLVHSNDFHQYLLSARKLRYFDPLLLNDAERKAFFLNVYNSLMIHAITVMSKPRTMFERVSLYNTAAYDIGGRPYSLNMIEHGVLRSNRPGNGPFAQVPFAENDARKLCVLPSVDPRIHFALNCGARSCPAVRFYEAESLDRTLDSATHVYLQEMEVDAEKRVITLPKLLQWYKSDFSADGEVDSLIKWTLPYLESYKRDLVNTLLQEKEQGLGSFRVVYAGYDWTVNDSS